MPTGQCDGSRFLGRLSGAASCSQTRHFLPSDSYMNSNQAASLVLGSYLLFASLMFDISHVDVHDAPPLSLAHVDVSTLSPRQLELAPEAHCFLLWMSWGSEEP
jgi:hypothetical protein